MLSSNSLLDNTVNLGGKLLETQNILNGGETLHLARKLLKFREQLRSFRKSMKLIRFTRSLPPQVYIAVRTTESAQPIPDTPQPVEPPGGCAVCSRFPSLVSCYHAEVAFGTVKCL